MEPKQRPERPWRARDGLHLIYALLLLQLVKALSLLVFAAVMGYSFDQVKELFALMSGTVEAVLLAGLSVAYFAWMFGGK